MLLQLVTMSQILPRSCKEKTTERETSYVGGLYFPWESGSFKLMSAPIEGHMGVTPGKSSPAIKKNAWKRAQTKRKPIKLPHGLV